MTRLLFVCTENKLRSPTAEQLFSTYPDTQAISCGTNKDAETPLSGDLVEWADVILVMEKRHKTKLTKKYQELLKDKRVICLDIADNYQRMQPELVSIFKNRVAKYLQL